MKRVLIFSTTYFPLVGGAEVAMKEVTDRLPGWQFDLICARIQKGLPSVEKIGNVTVQRCGFGSPVDKLLLPILGVGRALRIASRQEIACIWSLMASFGGFAALTYCWARPKTKMLLTLQEGDPLEHYKQRAGVLYFLHRMVFRRANAVQAISTFLGTWATEMGFKGTPEIVPNGVDIAKFTTRISPDERLSIRRSLGFGEQDVVIVTASRLSKKNAVDDLIRSLASLPPSYKLLIAGVGEDEAMLKALVKEQGVAARVMFVGKKSHDELPSLLQASDIFCRPSLSEGLGNSFLEAMAAGVPIIGTPVGGIVDFLQEGKTGVFCAPRDPASIASAALRIQTEPGLREALIRNGEQVVRGGYDWDSIATRLDALLKSISV